MYVHVHVLFYMYDVHVHVHVYIRVCMFTITFFLLGKMASTHIATNAFSTIVANLTMKSRRERRERGNTHVQVECHQVNVHVRTCHCILNTCKKLEPILQYL